MKKKENCSSKVKIIGAMVNALLILLAGAVPGIIYGKIMETYTPWDAGEICGDLYADENGEIPAEKQDIWQTCVWGIDGETMTLEAPYRALEIFAQITMAMGIILAIVYLNHVLCVKKC